MNVNLPLAYAQSLCLGLGSMSLLGLTLIFQKDIPDLALFGLCAVTGFACGLSAGSLLSPATQYKALSQSDSKQPTLTTLDRL